MEAAKRKTNMSKGMDRQNISSKDSAIMHRIYEDLENFSNGRRDYIPCFKEEFGKLKKIVMYYPYTEVVIDYEKNTITINGKKQHVHFCGVMQGKIFKEYNNYKKGLLDMVRKDLLYFPDRRISQRFFKGEMVGISIDSPRYGNAKISKSMIEIEKQIAFNIEEGNRKIVKQKIVKHADNIVDNAIIYFALKKMGYNK